jgi:hypothetical protein
LIIDEEDHLKNKTQYTNLFKNLYVPKRVKTKITKAKGMGPKVREVWPEVIEAVKTYKTPWVGLLNDDHVCITENWDRRLIEQLNGSNFITCNDHWRAPQRAAGATLWSFKLLEEVGWPIFPPQIDHLGIDDVWEQLGRWTGCWKVDMSVVVEHHHVFQDPDKRMDDTHARVYGRGNFFNSDAQRDTQKRLEKFKEELWQVTLDKVRAFRKDLPTTLHL